MSDLVDDLRNWAAQELGATVAGAGILTQAADRIDELERENQMLHERFDRYGLEVVTQGDRGHYVSPSVKGYINQLTKQVAKLKRRPSVATHNALQEEADGRMVAIRAMRAKIEQLTKRLAALQDNNANLTEKNAFLRQRPDLVLAGRIPAYTAMQARIDELKDWLVELGIDRDMIDQRAELKGDSDEQQ